jgi:hypothetical protein
MHKTTVGVAAFTDARVALDTKEPMAVPTATAANRRVQPSVTTANATMIEGGTQWMHHWVSNKSIEAPPMTATPMQLYMAHMVMWGD